MNVAVVDDNDDVRTVLATMVAALGHRTFEAATLTGALELDWTVIDRAIIDWRLGIDDGTPLVDWITEHHPDIVVMLLSASDRHVIPEHLRPIFRQKPIGMEDMRGWLTA